MIEHGNPEQTVMKRNDLILAAIAGLLMSAPAHTQEDEQFVGAHGATVPATYTAEDETLRLDLWPDQAFHLVRTPDDGAPEAFAGRWHADGRTLVLPLGSETLTLEVRNAERLRPTGAPEDASDDLVGGPLDPTPISLRAAGMFTYFADAPTFVHCATGLMHPVAQEGDYLDLERAYLEDRPGPAEPLFVTLDATIEMRPQMEGPDRLTLIADGFDATWPGETCARAAAAPRLTDTVWRLRSIDGVSITWSPPAREPFILFNAEDARVNASVGCNTMRGSFDADADGALSVGPFASTMMACPDRLAAQEATLAAAFEETASYHIGGRTLRLLDAEGAALAELQAMYLQ